MKVVQTTRLEFMECDACRAKPGTIVLCQGCLHNRAAISRLRATHSDISKADTLPEGCVCMSLAYPAITCPVHGR